MPFPAGTASTGGTRLLRRRRGGMEGHAPRPQCRCRTDRAAVDACCLHGGEEAAVEARIAQLDRAVARVMIQIHAEIVAWWIVAV